jgi:hypothetical protein
MLMSQKRKVLTKFLIKVNESKDVDILHNSCITHNSSSVVHTQRSQQPPTFDREKLTKQEKRKFVDLTVNALTQQVQYEQRTDPNPERRDKNGIPRKPDKLTYGLVRADKLLDEMTAEAIASECDHFRNSNLKNSYVVKGHGNGLGTQFSHPRMDFLCLGKRVTDKLKRKCETR